MSRNAELGSLISEARDTAKLTQKQMAERLGVHQTRISRLEQGGGSDSVGDFIAYLQALDTPEAHRLLQIISIEWKHLPQPSLRHPSLGALIEAEAAMERLDAFRQSETAPKVLAGQADLFYRRLSDFGEFLMRLDHKVIYIGEIGAGKTTAACRQGGLVLDNATAADLRGMLLDTGGGRTTLCDVVVRGGDRFALQVEPVADEEVYRLVAELCRSVVEKREGEAKDLGGADFKPAEEVERALRNMAGLPRPTRRRVRGNEVAAEGPQDPAGELARSSGSLEEFKAEFASRLTLWRRTRKMVEYEGVDQVEGRQWLRDTFTSINNGRHADFTLPAKIIVTVPFAPVRGTAFEIEIGDTRGVDGSAIRPDIVTQLKDRRAISVLCSKWGNAPEPSLQDLVKHMVDTEVDPTLISRMVFLVLARQGDALSMRYDSGEAAGETIEGYEIKQAQVQDALHRINLVGIDVEVFDAANDNPEELTEFLVSKIERLREVQAASARQTVTAIDQLLQNVEQAQSLATLGIVNNELSIFAGRHRTLKETRKPVYQRLITAVRQSHPRTVWAATRRSGGFWNFDAYQHLGDGAAADAKRRAASAVSGLREIIENKLADPAFETAHGFLEQLLDDIAGWEADFVRAARHHAVAVYKPVLSTAEVMWTRLDEMYGQGYSYKDEVAKALDAWFEEHEDLEAEIERRVARAWNTSVLGPLRAASGDQGGEGDDEQ